MERLHLERMVSISSGSKVGRCCSRWQTIGRAMYAKSHSRGKTCFALSSFAESDDLGEHLEVIADGLVGKSRLPVCGVGFHPGDQFFRFGIVERGEGAVTDHTIEIADCGRVRVNGAGTNQLAGFLVDDSPCLNLREPPSSLRLECRNGRDALPNLLHVEHACLLHDFMKFKHGAHSAPAESKRDSDFVLPGQARYILPKEAVSPFGRNPAIRLLPAFLTHVPTLLNFRLRARP